MNSIPRKIHVCRDPGSDGLGYIDGHEAAAFVRAVLQSQQPSDVRAVVDERLRELAEAIKGSDTQYIVNERRHIARRIHDWLDSAPREPAGEAVSKDSLHTEPAPATPAPPAGGDELRTRLHAAWRDHEDDDARDALREIGRLDAALAAERAEVGRLRQERDKYRMLTSEASTSLAELEAERDEARAESDRLRAALEPFAKAAAFWDQPDSTLAAVMNPDNTPAAVFVRKGEPWNYEITVGHLRAARAARLT